MQPGEHLAHLRKLRGLSQRQVAEELGVTRQSVSHWEAGGAFPSAEKQIALSQLYGVPPEELYPPQKYRERGGGDTRNTRKTKTGRTRPSPSYGRNCVGGTAPEKTAAQKMVRSGPGRDLCCNLYLGKTDALFGVGRGHDNKHINYRFYRGYQLHVFPGCGLLDRLFEVEKS